VDIDRQAIERRDFPITRRGYDPASVDAHLRALAAEIEQLQRERADGGSEPSLASTAGTQVQSILAAAEAAAADIERQARDSATTTREDAARDAASTREQAIEQARAHVAAVAQAAAVLLERVSSLDGEVSALVESVRSGATRLAGDLAAVETNMGELYDAASGKVQEPPVTRAVAAAAEQPPPSVPAPPAPSPPIPTPAAPQAARAAPAQPAAPAPAQAENGSSDPDTPRSAAPAAPAADSGDLDGARLIALNMALNGESRAETDRYLAENFQLGDRQKLVDEVYAAIDG
jgi:DivIVA domain-containing protein